MRIDYSLLLLLLSVAIFVSCNTAKLITETTDNTSLKNGIYVDKKTHNEIIVYQDSLIQFIPYYWNGNPRMERIYQGRIKGNKIIVKITGHDGDPSGPNWKPSTPVSSELEIIDYSNKKIILKALNSILYIKDYEVNFIKVSREK